MLNGALYYIDWENIQGTAPVEDTGGSISSNNVVDNIGDGTSYGFEIEGAWFMSNDWSLDFGYAWNKSTFNDGVTYIAAHQRWYCNDVVCPADGDVSGNYLARNSEHQLNGGLNLNTDIPGNWTMRWRLEGSYQSKQYTDPLNVAWVPDRTIANTSLTFLSPNANWDLTVWGRKHLRRRVRGQRIRTGPVQSPAGCSGSTFELGTYCKVLILSRAVITGERGLRPPFHFLKKPVTGKTGQGVTGIRT